MQYYSTFPKGFLPLVEEILISKSKGIQIINKGDTYIQYTSQSNIEEIKEYKFFEQTIYIVKYFNKQIQFKDLIHWIKSNTKLIDSKLSILGSNKYRMVGTSYILNKSGIQEYIDSISDIWFLDNKEYKYDLRVVQKEEYGYIGVRISNPPEYTDQLQKKSLRREIAYYMLHMSEIDKGDILLDPFCGGGIIPIMRHEIGQYQKIYASDIDVRSIKSKVGDMNISIIESDIDKLDIKVNKIVTDPPWGYIEDIDDLKKFYFNMLDRFYQLTYPNSIIVILTPHISLIEEYISINIGRYTVINLYTGNVSGRESNVVKLRRF
jgi:tRNA G10  N-methylase Trm11